MKRNRLPGDTIDAVIDGALILVGVVYGLEWAVRGVRWILAHVAIVPCALLALGLAGCGRERVVVKHEPVEVTKYVRAVVPDELTRDRDVVEPDPAGWRCFADGCRRVYTNEQLDAMRRDWRAAARESNADKAAIRADKGKADGR